MPETPTHDDEQFDRLLRDAGARMRAATVTALPPAVEPTGPRGTPRRWIVPVAIVTATAAAVVAAVWIAGPATETVREAPADTGVVSTPVSAVDSLPVVAPIDSSVPTETAPAPSDPVASLAPDELPNFVLTDADFDGAGGACLQLFSAAGTADGCFTHDQLSNYPNLVVVLADQAYEYTVNGDITEYTYQRLDDLCGHSPSELIDARWLIASCETDRFWFLVAPETPAGESATFVVPPRTGEPVALVPIESTLPDGYSMYYADYETDYTCLVVASFPDPWREACIRGDDMPRMLVPAGGSVFLVDPAPDFKSVDVNDIAVLSVPNAGCTSPVIEMAAPLDSSVMIDGLICTGDFAMITVPPVHLQYGPPDGLGYPLERADDGTWSTTGGGTSFPCTNEPPPMCATLGVDDDLRFAPLRIPRWGLIGAREHDLDPIEVTDDVRSIANGARNADEIAASVIAEYGTTDAGEGQDPVVESDDGEGQTPMIGSLVSLGLVTIDIDVLDDSITSERYAVWFRPAENGTLIVERAYRITACSRGVAAPDTCV